MIENKTYKHYWFIAGIIICSVLSTAFGGWQQFWVYLVLLGASVALYVIAWKQELFSNLSLKHVLILAIAARLGFLAFSPNMSDDVYRFIWDGKLQTHGINPYKYAPNTLQDSLDIDQGLFQQLNSPTFFTVYPPLQQGIYAAASWLSNGNNSINLLLLRLIIILADIASVLLIWRLTQGNSLTTCLFAFNPLVLTELAGNCHFEGVMLSFILLFLWNIKQQQWKLAGITMGMAISIKLIPILFLPLMIRYCGWIKSILVGLVAGFFTVLSFLPYYFEGIFQNYWTSVKLFLNYFEFNGSFYNVLREIGYEIYDKNIITELMPVLSAITLIALIVLIFLKKKNLEALMMTFAIVMTVRYLMATTVHPWYVIPLMVMTLFSNYYYASIWLLVMPLSYYHYAPERVDSIYSILLIIEYTVLAVALFFDLKQKKMYFKKSKLP